MKGERKMGMYTQLFLDVSLKQDTPKEIIEILKQMVSGECEYWDNRLNWCFKSSSYYFNDTHIAHIEKDDLLNRYKLLVLCDFKNYGNEIDILLNWLISYIEEEYDMIGYWRYEEEKEPVIIYKNQYIKEKENV